MQQPQRDFTWWASLASIVGLVFAVITWLAPSPVADLSNYQRLIISVGVGLGFLTVGIFLFALQSTGLKVWLQSILVILCVFTISYSVWVGTQIITRVNLSVPPQPVNMYQRFDFEQGNSDWKLALCRDDPCSNSFWDEVPSQLRQERPGFTGEHSLAIQAELKPDRGQDYTLYNCPTTVALADAISVNIYVPSNTELIGHIFVQPSGSKESWPGITHKLDRAGWHRLFLDLRHSLDSKGNTFSERAIACVHIDFYLPKAPSQQIEPMTLLVDDVEFFKPLSQ